MNNMVYYDVKCGTTLRSLIETLKEDGRALINLCGWGMKINLHIKYFLYLIHYFNFFSFLILGGQRFTRL